MRTSLPDLLMAPALAPLWQTLHRRLSSGRPVTSIRLDGLDSDGRSAVADLLGLARFPRGSVPLARLDEALADLDGLDVRAVVERLVGPVDDRAARRADATEAREQLWAWLRAEAVVRAQPVLLDWVEALRRTGVSSVPEARVLLGAAVQVLERLPADGRPLPAFADSVLHDPHALDEGTRLSGIVLRAVALLTGQDPPAGAEERRALWEQVGVAEDELSSTVLAAGLRPADAGVLSTVLRAAADAGHAVPVTLAMVRAADTVELPQGSRVHVVENPSILALALARFGPRCPPLLCTSGWPSGAAIRLVRLLAAHHNVLYHGDLDGDGVRIAAYIIDKTGAQPWRMTTADYVAAVPSTGPSAGRITPAPWDPDLASTLAARDVAVVEERVSDLLLADLEGAPSWPNSCSEPLAGEAGTAM